MKIVSCGMVLPSSLFVVDDAFPDVRGELRLGHLLGHERLLRNCPEFVVQCRH